MQQLLAELARLRAENEELKRKQARSAAPFSKTQPKKNPKRPGRKAGQGTFRHRPAPPPAAYSGPPEDVLVTETACPACGGELVEMGTEVVTNTELPPAAAGSACLSHPYSQLQSMPAQSARAASGRRAGSIWRDGASARAARPGRRRDAALRRRAAATQSATRAQKPDWLARDAGRIDASGFAPGHRRGRGGAGICQPARPNPRAAGGQYGRHRLACGLAGRRS